MWPWLTIVALLAGDPGAIRECLAVGRTPVEELGQSTAVFSGTVVAREWVPERYSEERNSSSWLLGQFPAGQERVVQRMWVRLEVHRVWKGEVPAVVRMRTTNLRFPSGAAGGEAHDYKFSDGESYLVYTYGPPEGLSTSICQRTRPLRTATEDLRALGEGRPPAAS